MKIAIISSANSLITKENKEKASQIVKSLSLIEQLEILTGGSLGLPGFIVEKARALGIKTVCYSPDGDSSSHQKRFDNQDLKHFDEVNHHKGFTLRSLIMLQEADAVLVLNGRMGTLSEFTVALEEGKRVGVVTNTGGIADELKHIVEVSEKDFSGRVFFSDDYREVLDWLLNS
jgi:uncharacterized protein (TIGR00725 family)